VTVPTHKNAVVGYSPGEFVQVQETIIVPVELVEYPGFFDIDGKLLDRDDAVAVQVPAFIIIQNGKTKTDDEGQKKNKYVLHFLLWCLDVKWKGMVSEHNSLTPYFWLNVNGYPGLRRDG